MNFYRVLRKKISLFFVFSLFLGMFALPTQAANTYEDLTKLDMPQSAGAIYPVDMEVNYRYQGKMAVLSADRLTDERLNYLLSVFSDNNLTFTGGAMTSLLSEKEYPQTGCFRFIVHSGTEEYQWEIHFDENRVYIWKRVIESLGKLIDYQGWFAYQNAAVYEDLIAFLDNIVSEDFKDEGDKKDEGQTGEGQKELPSVRDVNFLYTASLPLGNGAEELWWGVLSYVRSGETAPVTAPFISPSEPGTDAFQRYYLADEVKNNTVYFPMKKALTGKGSELKENSAPGTWTYQYKLQANVTENGLVSDLVVVSTHVSTNTSDTYRIDMAHCRQRGSLPKSGAAAFLSKNNIDLPKNDTEKNAETPKPSVTPAPTETAPSVEPTNTANPIDSDNQAPETTQDPPQETPNQQGAQQNTPEGTTHDAVIFSDIGGHWAENTINKWKNQGVLNGFPDGTFQPDANISRAELAKVMTLAFKLEEIPSDQNGQEWYSPYLASAGKYIPSYYASIPQKPVALDPYSLGFMPDSPALRIHVAEALAELKMEKENLEIDIPDIQTVKEDLMKTFQDSAFAQPFTDETAIDMTRMLQYTWLAKELHIMQGDASGYFRPYDGLTRAELITVIDRMLELETAQ